MKTLIRNPYLVLFALLLSLTQMQCTDDTPEVDETQMLIRISSIIQVVVVMYVFSCKKISIYIWQPKRADQPNLTQAIILYVL